MNETFKTKRKCTNRNLGKNHDTKKRKFKNRTKIIRKKKDHHELGRMIKKSKWANQEGT